MINVHYVTFILYFHRSLTLPLMFTWSLNFIFCHSCYIIRDSPHPKQIGKALLSRPFIYLYRKQLTIFSLSTVFFWVFFRQYLKFYQKVNHSKLFSFPIRKNFTIRWYILNKNSASDVLMMNSYMFLKVMHNLVKNNF